MEDKYIYRRRGTTAARLAEEALGPRGSPRRLLLLLESPWCGSSPSAVGIHWCATVPSVAGFWTCLWLVFRQVPFLLPPVPVRLHTTVTMTVYSRVSLKVHSTTQSAASSLDQSTSKLFPAPKPSRQGGGRPTLYFPPSAPLFQFGRATAAVTITTVLH